MIRLLVLLAATALVGLHAWVFWQRVVDGALFESGVAVRWLGALALGAAAWWLRRQGVSLLRGRSAAVFWLAVLVLHAGAPAPMTAAGALAHELPAELIVLFSLPVGLRFFGTRLDVRTVARRAADSVRLRAPRVQPILVRHYPPIGRRPPPF